MAEAWFMLFFFASTPPGAGILGFSAAGESHAPAESNMKSYKSKTECENDIPETITRMASHSSREAWRNDIGFVCVSGLVRRGAEWTSK